MKAIVAAIRETSSQPDYGNENNYFFSNYFLSVGHVTDEGSIAIIDSQSPSEANEH